METSLKFRSESLPMVILKFVVGLFEAIVIVIVIMLTSFHRKDRNASTIIYFVLTGLFVIVAHHEIQAHGNGAPKSRCDSMIPGHWVNAQTTLSPYQIIVDKTVISPGDRVNITLKTVPGQTGFKGFFVMVKEASEEENVNNFSNKNYGVFDMESSDMNHAQPVHCFDQMNSAVTHAINYVKDSVELSWIAPKLLSEDKKDGKPYIEKELKVVATFVRDFWTFWSDVEPVGGVHLMLTDINTPSASSSPRPVSPKLSSISPSFVPSPEYRGISPTPLLTPMTPAPPPPPPIEVDSDGSSSWTHFKRAWNLIVNLFRSSSSSPSSTQQHSL